ncbi:MAG: hypothetical protein KDA56_11385, partial [Hyphomonas sp.]|nr:hypothetical protein [Hyphomonas sp.]
LREEGAKAPGKILRLSGFRAGSARPGHKGKDGNKGGRGMPSRQEIRTPCKRPEGVIRDLKTRDFSEGI